MSTDGLDRRILEVAQSRFPIESRPYQALADQVGSTEDDVIERFRRLQSEGIVRQLGPVFDLHRLEHTSTLCAAKVDLAHLDAVVAFINGFDEITHNYYREHDWNVWFTVIAPSPERIEAIRQRIEEQEGVAEAISLPAERLYKIGLHVPTAGDDEE